MIWPLEQHAEVALELTVISGKDNFRFCVPASVFKIRKNLTDGIVDECKNKQVCTESGTREPIRPCCREETGGWSPYGSLWPWNIQWWGYCS